MKQYLCQNLDPNYNIAYGGLGGGGFQIEKLTSGMSNCGGGGGYTGGNSCVSDLRDDKTNLNNIITRDNSHENTIDFNGKISVILQPVVQQEKVTLVLKTQSIDYLE